MNWKIKLLLMVFIVLVLSCDKPEPEPIIIVPEDDTTKKPVIDDTTKRPVINDTSINVGGPCIYDTIDVYVVVDEIIYVDKSFLYDFSFFDVYFSVFTKSESEWTFIYSYRRFIEDPIKGSNCISNNLISVGDTIPGIRLKMITNGGCAPNIVKFLDDREKCFL